MALQSFYVVFLIRFTNATDIFITNTYESLF
jgi:hypothetical protein